MERIATYFAKREAKKRIMENFDIEAMKKKYSEESPEEKEKRTKMEMLPAVINICVGIAMVVVGALNDEECDDDETATYFLKVSVWLIYKFQ
jgi:acyl CoA:acetate/3-ketoacid CoA transferase